MADIRSLLRSEQASRRISHPHLTYTRSGQLLCTACGGLPIKSASLWEGHLRSPNHQKNAQKLIENVSNTNQAKKRKNDDDDEETRKRRAISEDKEDVEQIPETTAMLNRPKKKMKSVTFAEDTFTKPDPPWQEDVDAVTVAKVSSTAMRQPDPAAINEDEWVAFERDIAPLTKETPSTTNDTYTATIVAAPVTAAELSEQEQEARKPTKELEADEEKEDDVRRLEEELDVMEEMEERVRRLKEKREALRKSRDQNPTPGTAPAGNPTTEIEEPRPLTNGKAITEAEAESDDDNDYDDYDDWGFR